MLATLKKGQKITLGAALVVVIGGIIAVTVFMKPEEQKPKTGVLYYEGAMMNKSRTALVDAKGNIIKKLDPNRPDKDGTAVNPGSANPSPSVDDKVTN
jgi:flagellar biosynthesis/type III secretory pathway M-ring protein FliF/YscJ